MPKHVAQRPSICLNMIVRNEAHIVHEVLDATAPYISSWVIVDTGSTDGTQDIIKKHQANLGIPGELHERPWIDFGHNRTEALNLAQGHADYIWVMDADDTIAGTIDFTGLDADVYSMRNQAGDQANTEFWRTQLFRNGLPIHYEGVIHEQPASRVTATVGRIEGDYRIASRRLGSRDREQDLELLLAAAERNPQDSRSVLHLAQSYLTKGDWANAHKWLVRRTEMGGAEEEIFISLHQIAGVQANLGSPWPVVRDALLTAWEYRPTRAEPLFDLAQNYRSQQRYELGYRFAKIAADIPYPEQDTVVTRPDVYAFRATEEQVACAAALGAYPEAFTLCRNIIARPAVPDDERQRITANRDQIAPAMAQAAAQYPELLAQRLHPDQGERDIVVSLVAGENREHLASALNSFLNCCSDIFRAGRFLVLDTGLPDADRAALSHNYPFLEFTSCDAADIATHLASLRARSEARYWLQLGEGWRFFAPDNLISRPIAILEAEPDVAQVGINYSDASRLTGRCAPEDQVRRGSDTGRYVPSASAPSGPAMIDTTRIDQPGMGAATLDEVLATATPKPSRYITL